MATCANCIHHSLCDYNTNISGNGKVRLVYAEGADVKCSFFKNTADVVPKSEVENEIADDILRIAEECGGGVLFYRKMCKYAEELKSEINANENNN